MTDLRVKRSRTPSLPPWEPGKAGGEKNGENVGRLQSELASGGSSAWGAALVAEVVLVPIPSACKVALNCKLVAAAWKRSLAESRCCRLTPEVLSRADSRSEAVTVGVDDGLPGREEYAVGRGDCLLRNLLCRTSQSFRWVRS